MESATINLKQYITNGFVRSGISNFGYALILGIMTGGLGYAAYSLHQSNQVNGIEGMGRILEYLLLAFVGVILIMTLSLFYNGIKSFQHFGRFMKATDVNLSPPLNQANTSVQIGIALDYLNSEPIIYENRNMVLTHRHVIILEGDPCIYPISRLKKVSFDIGDLHEGRQPKLYQLKTVVLFLSQGETRKVLCRYLQEAQEIMKLISRQGIKIDSKAEGFINK